MGDATKGPDGLVVVVDGGPAARRVLRTLAGRDDLIGVSLVRGRGTAGPAPVARQVARVRQVARMRPGQADPLGGATSGTVPWAAALVERALAATPFVLVAPATGDDPVALVDGVGAAFGRRIAVVAGYPAGERSGLVAARLPAPSRPVLPPLAPLERDLLVAALGDDEAAAAAWRACTACLPLTDIAHIARYAPLIAGKLRAAGACGPDLARLAGVGRRHVYAAALYRPAASAVVGGLRRHGIDPIVVGGLAALAVDPAAPVWVDAVDLVVAPDERETALAVVGDAGWHRRGGPGQGRDHDVPVTLHSAAGLRLRLSGSLLAGRADRRLDIRSSCTAAGPAGAPVRVLTPDAALVRHWAAAAEQAERVSAVCATAALLARCTPAERDQALAWAGPAGVTATARWHLDALATVAAGGD